MHQYASKCMQNELCKCFMHEIIKEGVFIRFKGAKIKELLVALCDGRPCSVVHHHWFTRFGKLDFMNCTVNET